MASGTPVPCTTKKLTTNLHIPFQSPSLTTLKDYGVTGTQRIPFPNSTLQTLYHTNSNITAQVYLINNLPSIQHRICQDCNGYKSQRNQHKSTCGSYFFTRAYTFTDITTIYYYQHVAKVSLGVVRSVFLNYTSHWRFLFRVRKVSTIYATTT